MKKTSLSRYSWFIVVLLSVLIASCDTVTQADDENGQTGEEFSHRANPGTSAAEFLRDDRFTELLVEIQYMEGFRPTVASLTSLREFLEEHLDKTTITILEPEEIPARGQEEYSVHEIRDMEEEYRHNYSDGSTLASYNLIVDGRYDNQNVIGIAYYNTSNAFFGALVHDITGSPPFQTPRDKVEGTMFRHEYGHLLGLVDVGTPMQEDHKESGPHCSNDECVMYATVETGNFFANLFDGTIPNLDHYCRADIEAVKAE